MAIKRDVQIYTSGFEKSLAHSNWHLVHNDESDCEFCAEDDSDEESLFDDDEGPHHANVEESYIGTGEESHLANAEGPHFVIVEGPHFANVETPKYVGDLGSHFIMDGDEDKAEDEAFKNALANNLQYKNSQMSSEPPTPKTTNEKDEKDEKEDDEEVKIDYELVWDTPVTEDFFAFLVAEWLASDNEESDEESYELSDEESGEEYDEDSDSDSE